MSEPWTPGPWDVTPTSGGVWGANGTVLIAMVQHYSPDARLIAAAPEMAELLAEMADAIAEMASTIHGEFSSDPLGDVPVDEAEARARALLDRIRNGSPGPSLRLLAE